jgi:hypothetical protein
VGASEEITGNALRRHAKLEQVVLATKVFSRMTKDLNMQGSFAKTYPARLHGSPAALALLPGITRELQAAHGIHSMATLHSALADLMIDDLCGGISSSAGELHGGRDRCKVRLHVGIRARQDATYPRSSPPIRQEHAGRNPLES